MAWRIGLTGAATGSNVWGSGNKRGFEDDIGWGQNEANVSAEEPKGQDEARVSEQKLERGRAEGAGAASDKR